MINANAISSNTHTQGDYEGVLSPAVDLTMHISYVELTKQFLKKIYAVKGIVSATVYEVHGFESAEEPTDVTTPLMLIDIVNILNKAVPFYERIHMHPSELTEKNETHIFQESDTLQSVFPITIEAACPRIVVIESIDIRKDGWEFITGLIKIFSNLLCFIDSKDRDDLTGLLNRQTFNSNLTNIVSHAKRQTRIESPEEDTSWIAMIDIDHFKKINDQHGHIQGDNVLVNFSSLMKKTFRYSDILFRYGGEEFITVINACSETGAFEALERFRNNVQNSPLSGVDVTTSIGYVELDTGKLPWAMVDEADKALYQAKDSGRNQTVSYNTM